MINAKREVDAFAKSSEGKAGSTATARTTSTPAGDDAGSPMEVEMNPMRKMAGKNENDV